MPLVDITNPEMIMILNEAYDKEKRLRSNWVSKNAASIQLAATLNREPTNYYEEDVIKHTMYGGMAAIIRDHEVAVRNRRKVPLRDAKFIPGIASMRHEYSLINVGVGNAEEDPRLARPDSDFSPDPLMRPVDADTKKILYKSIPNFGREKYIRERNKILPEKRYYLPECVSWDHGWRMGDSKMEGKTKHGRNWVLQKTLKGRVGPTRDPDHYKQPEMTYEKCAL